MKLAHRFLVAFLVVVLVSGGVLFGTFDAHRSDVTDSAEMLVDDRAETSAAFLDDRIREQRRTVELAATNPDLGAHGTDRQERALATFVETSTFDGATVVDESGEIRQIVTDEGEDVAGENIGHRSYVQRALAGETYVSDPFVAATDNYIVVISTPLVVDGEVVGTVNGAYHLTETGLFEPLVADDDRQAVTVSAGEETMHSTADGFEETVDGSADLEVVDWTVTAHEDRRTVDATTDRLALFQALSGLALLGTVTAFGVWVYRSTVRRIGHLLERVQALRRREYDAGPALDGPREWRRIDDALDRLAAALSRREEMLLVLNRILRHNLRNTLNVVVGRAEGLERDLEGRDREAATEIRAASEELLALAERARTTERLLEPTEPSRTDVAALVRDRTEAFEAAAPSVTVSRSVPERAEAACGEELSLAIDELLSNVAEHAGPDPTATVSVDVLEDAVRVRIADDGDGIPDEAAALATGETEISQLEHAGGIGLWLVDWIVSRYDGTLRIRGSDSGTVVELEVPRWD